MFNKERRIVITGLGVVSPIGLNVPDFWLALSQGKSGVRRLKNIAMPEFHVNLGAEIDLPENAKDSFKNRKMFKRLDRFVILGALAGAQAVADSGLDIEASPERYGTLIASGEGGLDTHWEQVQRIATKGPAFTSPFYITNVIPNTASAFVSQEHNLQGPSYAISSACASSNHALGTAAMMIKMGMADAMFAGGSEAVCDIPSIAAFGTIGALSARNDDPDHASRPFDRDRDGFVMGEGSGVLCLEELEHARKRGAKIYGELTGFGFSSDAYDLVAPHPEGRGASRAITGSLEMSGINPEEVGLINCHGTSTPVGDMAECIAINRALGADLATSIPSHSTKSMIGHLIGGTSAVEAIAALMVFEQGIIHPTINQFNKDPQINLNVIKEARDGKAVNHILSNAFGFGGHNACVVLSRFRG